MDGATKFSLQFVCVCLALAAATGARADGGHEWQPPIYASPGTCDPDGQSPADVESAYAAAAQTEADGSPSCVDFYFDAAVRSWSAIERNLAERGFASPRLMDIHRSAISKLLVTAQRLGRWNPATGLEVHLAEGPTIVPIQFNGFPWTPKEFQHLEPVGDYSDPRLSRRFRSDGIGAPLVVLRHSTCPQPFTQSRQTFAATVVVRSCKCGAGGRLEFYNPLNASTTNVAGCDVPLARDISAPFAVADEGPDRVWITSFLRPDTDGSQNRLFMIEPYQRGKIPVVFIHGLLSDPKTWVDLVNELRARPELNARYQWWAYRYATGGPFLESATGLRRQLAQIRCVYDPQRTDAAMSDMVLIGHSMGGLIAKLQVTYSGDRLWRSIADQPLSSVRTTHDIRQRLQENFFFIPSCDVSRVVFIGTPHQGSPRARRPLGRLASAMVEPSAESRAEYQQLTNNNPHLFRGIDVNRFPTSIDLLEPTNPLLRATASLLYSPHVTLHSIVGVSWSTCDGEPSDGVVPVSSAQLCGVMTERQVDAIHTRLHRAPASIDEIACILREHLR